MKKEIVWPRGCQSAAMICVMLDAEFIWLSMDAQRYDTPKHRSMGDYGPLRGVDRILGALNRFHAKATFFTPGIFAEAYPDTVKKIVQAGHEIALHGHHHEDFATLSPEEQRARDPARLPVGDQCCREKAGGLPPPRGWLHGGDPADHP